MSTLLILLLPIIAVVVTAPFGATILGWMAVSQIRRSEGNLCGMGLALFAGLVFPLLALDGVIGLIWVKLYRTAAIWSEGSIRFTGISWLLLPIVTVVIADILIVLWAWQAAKKPGGGITAKPRISLGWVFGVVAVLCVVAGFIYQERQFKYKAFGSQIKYGILSPEHAYAELLTSHDQRARDAALQYIVQNRIQSHPVIAKSLEKTFGSKDSLAIPPMAALAMNRFDLLSYLHHPDANQRLAAVFASRWWRAASKVDVLIKFLEDPDSNVVGQTIYELGQIGDLKVFGILSESRFDKMHFIEDVRKSLKASASETQQAIQTVDWNAVAASGARLDGLPVTVDGSPALKVENTREAKLEAHLLTLDRPAIPAKKYEVIGQVKYENVEGTAYLEMWSHFQSGEKYFSKTLAPKNSGPMAIISGSSGWRSFSLPFDRSGTTNAVSKIEMNLCLPGKGVVYLRKVKLVQGAPLQPATSKLDVETARNESSTTHTSGIFFGPVMKRTLSALNAEGGEFFLDLETGEFRKPSVEVWEAFLHPDWRKRYANSTAEKWIRTNGVDLAILQAGQSVNTFDCNLQQDFSQKLKLWDNMSAQGLLQVIEEYHSKPFHTQLPWLGIVSTGVGFDYWFHTREGNSGILKITAFNEKSRSLTIRYKLVIKDASLNLDQVKEAHKTVNQYAAALGIYRAVKAKEEAYQAQIEKLAAPSADPTSEPKPAAPKPAQTASLLLRKAGLCGALIIFSTGVIFIMGAALIGITRSRKVAFVFVFLAFLPLILGLTGTYLGYRKVEASIQAIPDGERNQIQALATLGREEASVTTWLGTLASLALLLAAAASFRVTRVSADKPSPSKERNI